MPERMTLELGALLEPTSVAMHAIERANLSFGSSVLVFGAGAVGLLVATLARCSGAGEILIADIDQVRLDFAVNNGFADSTFTVSSRRSRSADEEMKVARGLADEISRVKKSTGAEFGEADVTIDCTGVASCVQSAIHVCTSLITLFLVVMLTSLDNPTRWKGGAGRYGKSSVYPTHLRGGAERGRYHWQFSVCQLLSSWAGNTVEAKRAWIRHGKAGDTSLQGSREC